MSEPATVPVLVAGLNEQEAIFVQEFVRTNNAMHAFVTAKIRESRYSVEVAVQRLLARPEIQAAIASFREASKRAGIERPQISVTRGSLMADFQDIYEDAREVKDLNAAIRAKVEQATLQGLRVEKREVTVETDIKNLSTQELMRLLAEAQGKSMIDVTPEK